MIHEDSKRGGVDENVEHAANLTRIFANLLENCANHKTNITNLLKIVQT